jgi:hypothetical protein
MIFLLDFGTVPTVWRGRRGCRVVDFTSTYSIKSSQTHFIIFYYNCTFDLEEFEDTKGVIRIRISEKNIQHNVQKKKVEQDKQRSTKHTYETKDRVTRTPLKTEGELGCYIREDTDDVVFCDVNNQTIQIKGSKSIFKHGLVKGFITPP